MYSQFRPGEVRDILIAWIVTSIAISAASLFARDYVYVAAAFIAAATAFILHEMGHKFIAIRYGYRAHFQLWTWGILLILITGLASGAAGFGILFGAPGAVYIEAAATGGYFGYGYYSSNYRVGNPERESMLISAAGPAMNLGFMVLFFGILLIAPVSGFVAAVGEFGFGLNLSLGAFNMIPFPPLDGYKIFSKSIPVGLGLALPLWLTFLYLVFIR